MPTSSLQKPVSLTQAVGQDLPDKAFTFSQADLEKLKSLGMVALAIIGTLGVVAVAAAAPNIFKAVRAIPRFKRQLRKTNSPKKNIARTFYYLKRQNYVRLVKRGGDYLVEITEKGKKRLEKMNFNKLKIPHRKIWDGNWWLVLADIPKDFRYQADLLRQKVKDMNFYLLQRTAWFYPFDPRGEIAFVSAYYGIDRFVTVLKASWIDPQDEMILKQYFHLK